MDLANILLTAGTLLSFPQTLPDCAAVEAAARAAPSIAVVLPGESVRTPVGLHAEDGGSSVGVYVAGKREGAWVTCAQFPGALRATWYEGGIDVGPHVYSSGGVLSFERLPRNDGIAGAVRPSEAYYTLKMPMAPGVALHYRGADEEVETYSTFDDIEFGVQATGGKLSSISLGRLGGFDLVPGASPSQQLLEYGRHLSLEDPAALEAAVIGPAVAAARPIEIFYAPSSGNYAWGSRRPDYYYTGYGESGPPVWMSPDQLMPFSGLDPVRGGQFIDPVGRAACMLQDGRDGLYLEALTPMALKLLGIDSPISLAKLKSDLTGENADLESLLTLRFSEPTSAKMPLGDLKERALEEFPTVENRLEQAWSSDSCRRYLVYSGRVRIAPVWLRTEPPTEEEISFFPFFRWTPPIEIAFLVENPAAFEMSGQDEHWGVRNEWFDEFVGAAILNERAARWTVKGPEPAEARDLAKKLSELWVDTLLVHERDVFTAPPARRIQELASLKERIATILATASATDGVASVPWDVQTIRPPTDYMEILGVRDERCSYVDPADTVVACDPAWDPARMEHATATDRMVRGIYDLAGRRLLQFLELCEAAAEEEAARTAPAPLPPTVEAIDAQVWRIERDLAGRGPVEVGQPLFAFRSQDYVDLKFESDDLQGWPQGTPLAVAVVPNKLGDVAVCGGGPSVTCRPLTDEEMARVYSSLTFAGVIASHGADGLIVTVRCGISCTRLKEMPFTESERINAMFAAPSVAWLQRNVIVDPAGVAVVAAVVPVRPR